MTALIQKDYLNAHRDSQNSGALAGRPMEQKMNEIPISHTWICMELERE